MGSSQRASRRRSRTSIHVAGGDGGTGASPLTSIKSAGAAVGARARGDAACARRERAARRVRLRVDGGIKTGRDVVVAALLGADEVSFGTALLLAEGCLMVRSCHVDTCPVGIATQRPELRAKFAATPEMVETYLLLVAEEARRDLALARAALARRCGRPQRPARAAPTSRSAPRCCDVAACSPPGPAGTGAALPVAAGGELGVRVAAEPSRRSRGRAGRPRVRDPQRRPRSRCPARRRARPAPARPPAGRAPSLRGVGGPELRRLPPGGRRVRARRRGERLRRQGAVRRPHRRSAAAGDAGDPVSSATPSSTAPPAASSSARAGPASASRCGTRARRPSSRAPASTRAST